MSLFASFAQERILYQDDHRVVVDKPIHVPCQEARCPGEDLVSRLKKHLGLDYLGVFQRLDSETSGVIAYSTSKEGNGPLSADLKEADKIYVAAVDGYGVDGKAGNSRGGEQTLVHYLRPKSGGGSEICSERDARGKRAEMRVRVFKSKGRRTLLRIQLITGRTHQIRVQLAAIGCPVVGDARYGLRSEDTRSKTAGKPSRSSGRRPSPHTPLLQTRLLQTRLPQTRLPTKLSGRMLLHAYQLKLGGKMFEAPLPPEFDSFLDDHQDAKFEGLSRLVRAAAQRRFGLFHDTQTTAFRLFEGDREGAPGLSLDIYRRTLVAHLRSDDAHAAEELIASQLQEFDAEFDALFVKRRPRKANELVDPKKANVAPSEPLWGKAESAFEIQENGMKMLVDVADGLSTGLFLDQRDARLKVRKASSGARVLNLFAYTSPFGLAAALGGAAEVINVDASGVALGRGKENFALNGVSGRFLRADAFDYLRRAGRKGDLFDLVICDPPTYATTKKKRWKSQAGWVELAAQCIAVTRPGGRLLLCSNDSRMSQGRFRRYVREGAESIGRQLTAMRDGRESHDFPQPIGRDPMPRRLWLTV